MKKKIEKRNYDTFTKNYHKFRFSLNRFLQNKIDVIFKNMFYLV